MAVLLLNALAAGDPAAAQTQGADGGEPPSRLEQAQRLAREALSSDPTRESGAEAEAFPSGAPFLVRFSRGVEGLQPGVPVRILGMRTGTVREVTLTYDSATGRFEVPVVLDLVPDRLSVDGQSPGNDEAAYEVVARMVEQGLRARLQGGDLLSGPVHIALEVIADATPATLGRAGAYPEIPAIPTRAEELNAILEDLLAKLRELPLEALVDEAKATLSSVRDLVTGKQIQDALDNLVSASDKIELFAERLETQMSPLFDTLIETTEGVRQTVDEARRTVEGARQTLDRTTETVVSLERAVGSRAPLWSDVQKLVRELTAASRALRLFAETLERHPEALIRGKEGGR